MSTVPDEISGGCAIAFASARFPRSDYTLPAKACEGFPASSERTRPNGLSRQGLGPVLVSLFKATLSLSRHARTQSRQQPLLVPSPALSQCMRASLPSPYEGSSSTPVHGSSAPASRLGGCS